MTNLESLRAKIKGDCWEWQGHITKHGYGRRKVNGKNINIHRAIFEATIRKIPEGMVVDHLCRNRKCVNPFHLEIVSIGENVLRGIGIGAVNYQKTHCKRGHLLMGDNIKINSQGARVCQTCLKKYVKQYKQKLR